MSYGRPAQANKIKINSCSARDLESIPGVGRKTVDLICNLRDTEGSITPEMFATLGIRNLPAAMESIDFENWTPASDKFSGRTSLENPMAMGPPYPGSPGLYANAWGPGPGSPHPGNHAQSAFYGYQPMTAGASMLDPSQDWRWNQYRSPSQRSQQPYHVKTEPEDFVNRLATPIREPKAEAKSAPRVNVPKGISYDGKSDWQAFINKFASYADREGWNSKTRRDVLSWVLEGAASKFYAQIIKRNPALDYFEVVDKLAKRFDIRDLPETTQMLFTSAVQGPKESLVEWCDRISTMATQAFPDWTDEQISRQTVLRFCQGCADKEAGFHTINTKPKSLEAALDEIKRYQQSSITIYGKPRKDIRKVEPEEEEEDYPSAVRATKFESNRRPQRTVSFNLDENRVGERIGLLERNMSQVMDTMKNMETAFRALESKLTLNASASILKSTPPAVSHQYKAAPARRTPVGDTTKRACYYCGEEGHFKVNCPRLKKVSQVEDYEDTLPFGKSDSEEEYEEPLNGGGSEY